MRVLPRAAGGAAEVPPLGGARPSRKRRHRERYEIGDRDPYDPELLLVALEYERDKRPPAERLLLAILEEAIRSYVRTVDAKSGKARQLYASTRDWIAARDHSWLCSFESICETLDLEANRIRRALYAWKLARRA